MESVAMDKHNLKWRAKIMACLTGLFLIGLNAVAALIAIRHNMPIVLVPFAVATLISLGMVWWAQRYSGEPAASPLQSEDESRQRSD